MPDRQNSIYFTCVVFIQVKYVLCNNFFNYNNGLSFTPKTSPPYPGYSYPSPIVISLNGNNNGENNNRGSNNDNLNMLEFFSLFNGNQNNNNNPVFVPYPIPIPIPYMFDGDHPYHSIFEDVWESYRPGNNLGFNPGVDFEHKRKTGKSKSRGKSNKKSSSNAQNSKRSSNAKKMVVTVKDQSQGTLPSRRKSNNKIKPKSSDSVENDDQNESKIIDARSNTITESSLKPDNDYEDYENEEQCNTCCKKKKVYRTQIVLKT